MAMAELEKRGWLLECVGGRGGGGVGQPVHQQQEQVKFWSTAKTQPKESKRAPVFLRSRP